MCTSLVSQGELENDCVCVCVEEDMLDWHVCLSVSGTFDSM